MVGNDTSQHPGNPCLCARRHEIFVRCQNDMLAAWGGGSEPIEGRPPEIFLHRHHAIRCVQAQEPVPSAHPLLSQIPHLQHLLEELPGSRGVVHTRKNLLPVPLGHALLQPCHCERSLPCRRLLRLGHAIPAALRGQGGHKEHKLKARAREKDRYRREPLSQQTR